jgi:hypothetical protein
MAKSQRTIAERFWAFVPDQPTDPEACWIWRGGRNGRGYGQFTAWPQPSRTASRVAWELVHGPIPRGLCVLHSCDTRPCVRPSHLFLGTFTDNNRDAYAKGRKVGPRRWGADNGNFKLPMQDRPMIRELYRTLAPSGRAGWGQLGPLVRRLAAEYHVSEGLIRQIMYGSR